MTARDVAVDQVAQLPVDGVQVIPYSRNLEAVAPAGTLMVKVESIVPEPAPRGWRRYTITLFVIVPETDPKAAEDHLDALLEDVLLELEKPTTPLTWTNASRDTFEEKWPCWSVTLSVPFTKE